MALFRKKKRVLDATPELILISLFDPDALAAHDAGSAQRFTVRAAAPDEGFPGKSASVAYSGSNVPVAACVAGSELASRSRSWLADGALGSGVKRVWVETEVEDAFRDSFRWLVLEMASFALMAADGRVQALVWLSDAFLEKLRALAEAENLKRGKRRGNAPATVTVDGDIPGAPSTGVEAFRVDRARDLPVLSTYCAQQFKAGERVFSTVPSAFGFCATGKELPEAPDGPCWFKGTFECLMSDGKDAKPFTFLYSFSRSALPPNLGDAEASRFIAALATGTFSESVRRYLALSGLKPGRLACNPLPAPPELAGTADLFFLDFRARDSSLSVPARVVAPIASLVPLAQAWKHPLSLTPGMAEGASVLLGVNARILAKVLPAIIESPELRPRVPRFCVNELLRLLSDHDARLVIQNVLIPDFGAKRMPGLVFYAVTVKGSEDQERQAILPYGPFDPKRFDSFLPDGFKRVFYEQTRSLAPASPGVCAELNDEALHAVMRAALGGRIGATERLKYLMREIVLKADNARAEASMAELRGNGIPFGILKGLEPKAAQRVAAAVDDRDFALALVDCPEEIAGMRKYASRAKTDRLREDLSFIRMLIAEGSLTLSDALAAKERIAFAIKRDEEREREREEIEAGTPPPSGVARAGPSARP